MPTYEENMCADSEKCAYIWKEDDGWAFLAWAMGIEEGAEILALQSGYQPYQVPAPGVKIYLPVCEKFSEILTRRLRAARLVRDATQALQNSDTLAAMELLEEAIDMDSSWSVPAYDLSLLLMKREGIDSALKVLEPVSYKYDAALIHSYAAWNRGDTETAIRRLEICLMDETPPFEALAAAALIYTVTGHDYQASNIWRRILAAPEADASIRLMAVEYALLQEERRERER